MKKTFFKAFLFVVTAVFIISCDKDFNEIGGDFVDNDHYGFETTSFEVKAYNEQFGSVQTNNQPLNLLGYYNNPVFGRTTANFVTQLELNIENPVFYKLPQDIVIDSVYLHVPYFSKVTNTDSSTGNRTFDLDSVYGSGKIKLEVFRSGYFLRNLDPNGLQEQQIYYNDNTQRAEIEGATNMNTAVRLNNSTQAYQNDDFEFSPNEIKFLKADGVTVRERLLPGIYMDLDKTVFKSAIIQGGANINNNNIFKNYFRGIYFKVTPHTSNPNGAGMANLNFAQGKIVIVYKDKLSTTDATEVRKTLTLNMKGYTVNLTDTAANGNAFNTNFLSSIANPDRTNGDQTLYLKGGGGGSMAVVELFKGLRNNETPLAPAENPLQKMRRENWLINEANLVFTVDQNIMTNTDLAVEPNRVLLYDLNNKRPLIDYYFDTSTFTDIKFNKLIHSGIIRKTNATSRGTSYKVRITNHIRNLVNNGGNAEISKDSTNVKLGLVVTENINTVANAKLKNPFPYFYQNNPVTGLPETRTVKFVPAATVMNPLGTALYGNNIPVGNANYDKRVRLEIIYTKPD